MAEPPTLPVTLRVHLAHATVQAIADESGADILHIKGPSVDPALRPRARASADADVLVRPAHLNSFMAGLKAHGWQQVTRLPSGGLVEHSTNWYHGELGQMDVHVRFPGIQVGPDRAFERLWQGRTTRDIARRPCVVPDLVGQRLVLLLHAARGMAQYQADVKGSWLDASAEDRNAVTALAVDLRAEVALAVATGHLEDYRDHPEYDLWRLYADGATTTSGFRRLRAEFKATPEGSTMVRLRVVGYALRILLRMPHRLSVGLARKPTAGEVARGYTAFLRRGRDLTGTRKRSD
ncbi:nucleotidyltransferase family protein [Aestuariimicrobium sp. Y1814]|uniref:nucleotidyltransferase family protein n=1 Tax=Aestuariimicrobium sp. Y1814 TaxID=3418742 RepID=UPI003DA708DE